MVFVPRLAAAAARRRLVHLTSHPRPFSTRPSPVSDIYFLGVCI